MPRAKKDDHVGEALKDEQVLELLRDPAISLQTHAKVLDQGEAEAVPYDPYKITENLQATIVGYASDPPMTEDGHTRWLTILAYRQAGKSLAGELAFYPKAAYNEGWDHVCIADTQDRADYLHDRVQFTHSRWDERYRQRQVVTSETRQLRFVHGAKMRVLSAHAEAVGIGQSVDSLHGSEVAYWKDAGTQFSLINPAMINRRKALMLLECTPAPLSVSSAEWWKDKCRDAKLGLGRDIYAFFPFWDGKLNRRPWPKKATIDKEEEELLRKYGKYGLRLEHLAFRRLMFDTDPKIRRNHKLFATYYPFDDLSCWLQSARSIIPEHALERHKDIEKLVPWPEKFHGLVEYRDPLPGVRYAIYVDPSGHGARDHAAFQAFECWEDGQVQIGSYASIADPPEVIRALEAYGKKLNNALIVVERNGVGDGVITGLELRGYPNIYHAPDGAPGVWKHNHDEFVSRLIDMLMDDVELFDEDLVNQLVSYQSDKAVELSMKAELMGTSKNSRRDRHHWDKVSALMVGAMIRHELPRSRRPPDLPPNVVPFSMRSWDEIQAYQQQVARDTARRQNGQQRTRPYRRPKRR